MDKPIQLKDTDFENLKKECQDYLDFIDNDEEYHEDSSDKYENAVFEAAMEAVFGKDVWEFVNDRINSRDD